MYCKTADLCDEHAATVRVLAPIMRSYSGVTAFHGEIATVKVFEDNNLLRDALSQNGKGKVLVVDGGGSLRTALIGDELAQPACNNHWAGIIVNGCIRDSAEVGKIAVGVCALNTNPTRPAKDGAGEARVPVTFGGVTMTPGEFIYADDDDVAVARMRLV